MNRHVKTYKEVTCVCSSCKNTFTIKSTYHKDKMSLETCYKCHPAYSSTTVVSRIGRAQKFRDKYGDLSLQDII